MRLPDPLAFGRMLWPGVEFYDRQREVIYSVWDDSETVCVAGNELGKDFVAGFLAVVFFLTRNPCRIVTTSAKDKHLDVLWGEINRFIQTSAVPLSSEKGGPLLVNHRSIRKIVSGERCPLSYVTGLVASPETAESLQGHHVANIGDGVSRTLFIADEASSLPDSYYDMADPWAKRKLIIGNPWPCSNFFYRADKGSPDGTDKGGDIPRPNGDGGFYRRLIRIRAEDSPNVQLAQREVAMGRGPSGRMVIPGVKSYDEYVRGRRLWDKVRQCVGLDAQFYEGKEVRLFPPEWLNLSAARAAELRSNKVRRSPKSLGVDSGEGWADTSMYAVDELGVVEGVSQKTPDTSKIPGLVVAFGRKHGVPPENWMFDRGGGGKQHADRLRAMGYNVRTVGFGEGVTPEPRHGIATIKHRTLQKEERYAYKNRRAEMYGLLREEMDPTNGPPFAIPAEYDELRRQLAPIPLDYDDEGRLVLPPKDKRDPDSKKVTMKELLGRSPDDADALVLAVYGMLHKPMKSTAGVMR